MNSPNIASFVKVAHQLFIIRRTPMLLASTLILFVIAKHGSCLQGQEQIPERSLIESNSPQAYRTGPSEPAPTPAPVSALRVTNGYATVPPTAQQRFFPRQYQAPAPAPVSQFQFTNAYAPAPSTAQRLSPQGYYQTSARVQAPVSQFQIPNPYVSTPIAQRSSQGYYRTLPPAPAPVAQRRVRNSYAPSPTVAERRSRQPDYQTPAPAPVSQRRATNPYFPTPATAQSTSNPLNYQAQSRVPPAAQRISPAYGAPSSQFRAMHPYAPAPTAQRISPQTAQLQQANLDLFWDNQRLCSAEYDLEKCLLNARNRQEFLLHSHIIGCTTTFVQGLCGSLTRLRSKRCDIGRLRLDQRNCPSAAFAEALLVYNRMIEPLEIIMESNPAVPSWALVTTNLALQTARNKADCVTTAYLNFLNQMATGVFISEEDMHCVERSRNSSTCSYIQDNPEGWNLPALIQRYGVDRALKAIEKLKYEHQLSDFSSIVPDIKTAIKTMVSEDANRVHYISVDYNQHKSVSSIDVCPENFISMNEHLEHGDGMPGLDEDQLAFHFPLNKTFTDGVDSFEADPLTDLPVAYQQCADWFEYTRSVFNVSEKSTIENNRCFSIDGYNLQYIESGQSKALSYAPLKTTTAAGDKCFKSSWLETESCFSHLTEWQMVATCCKSYATVVREASRGSASTLNQRVLLEELEEAANRPRPQTQNFVRVTVQNLLYRRIVSSNSKTGALGSPDSEPSTTRTLNMTSDSLVDKLASKCTAIQDIELRGYFGEKVKRYCDKLSSNKTADAKNSVVLMENAKSIPRREARLVPRRFYVNTDTASLRICEQLSLNLDFSRIVPLVSGRCFPQACLLAKLTSCIGSRRKTNSVRTTFQFMAQSLTLHSSKWAGQAISGVIGFCAGVFGVTLAGKAASYNQVYVY